MSRKKKQRVIDIEKEAVELGPRGKEKKEDRWKKNVVVSAQTAGQKEYIKAILNNDIIFCTGPAGTGKTIVAVGLALQQICAPVPAFDKLVIMRPAKEACDEHIGFLPGQIEDKLQPYLAPVMDNAEVFLDKTAIKNLIWQGKIESIPLAFMRGRSLNKSIIICDEGQNLTVKQTLLCLTRLGKGSKMIINGDLSQSDIKEQNGLADAKERLQGIPCIAFVELTEKDIVRHPLIIKILERYFGEPSA